jgi:DNA-binding protein HU-beta
LSKTNANRALNAIIESIKEEVKEGGKVTLVGFGTFYLYQRAARKGINPRTKTIINIPIRKSAKFKASSTLSNL